MFAQHRSTPYVYVLECYKGIVFIVSAKAVEMVHQKLLYEASGDSCRQGFFVKPTIIKLVTATALKPKTFSFA